MRNYFELFNLDKSFDIDLKQLESIYQQQIAQHHPDRFANQGEKEKSEALQNTSLINTAYDTLKSPLNRATYLLDLAGINAFDEKDTHMDADFLIAQIDLRERLGDIESTKDEMELDDFIDTIESQINHHINKISALFADTTELDEIKTMVRELKFYVQLHSQAKRLMDEWL